MCIRDRGNAAIPGESLGSIIGSSITRVGATIENSRWVGGDGGLAVNNQGSYDETFDPTIIGDANPDWIANISNSLSYKNLSLNFLFNFQAGGDIYSTTVATLLGRGLTTAPNVTCMEEEKVILVDTNDNPIGVMPKMEAHKKALLHLSLIHI